MSDEDQNAAYFRFIGDGAAKARAEVAEAIGQVAFEWNGLQEVLGNIFGRSLGLDYWVAKAIWYSTSNDRSQREMLKAGIDAIADTDWLSRHPTSRGDILWVIKQANVLADRRNDAIHSPFDITILLSNNEFRVRSSHNTKNPRATKLKDKDVLVEFRWYALSTQVLKDYCAKIHNAIYYADDENPWPEKPLLPTLSQS